MGRIDRPNTVTAAAGDQTTDGTSAQGARHRRTSRVAGAGRTRQLVFRSSQNGRGTAKLGRGYSWHPPRRKRSTGQPSPATTKVNHRAVRVEGQPHRGADVLGRNYLWFRRGDANNAVLARRLQLPPPDPMVQLLLRQILAALFAETLINPARN
jgi:hypothetical protein